MLVKGGIPFVGFEALNSRRTELGGTTVPGYAGAVR